MATDVAPVVAPDLAAMLRACEAAGSTPVLLERFVLPALACVEYDVVCETWDAEVADVGDAAAAFCRLAPWALKADRKEPKKGRLVVGMLAMTTVGLMFLHVGQSVQRVYHSVQPCEDTTIERAESAIRASFSVSVGVTSPSTGIRGAWDYRKFGCKDVWRLQSMPHVESHTPRPGLQSLRSV